MFTKYCGSRALAVVTQMTGSAHRTYTKLIKYALRITSLQSGRVKYTSFSVCFTIDFLWIFVVFLVSVFWSGSTKVVEYARPSCVSVAFTVSELCSKL